MLADRSPDWEMLFHSPRIATLQPAA
jgi:hypothetical protein